MGMIKAFPLANAAHLPVTGDLHPLRKEFTRWLSWSNAIVIVTCGAIFGGWYFYSQANKAEEVPRNVQIVKFTELGVPPSIAKESAPSLNVAEAIVPPTIGVPEPVLTAATGAGGARGFGRGASSMLSVWVSPSEIGRAHV